MTTTTRLPVVRDVVGQCHGSTVCQVADGFLVAWFQGAHEGAADSRVMLSRSSAGTWSEPVVVSGDLAPCWNPVLHVQRSGRVLLYLKVGTTIPGWSTWLVESDDEGRTWSDPRPLVPGDSGGRGPVRTPPLRLPDGRLLAGASTESWGDSPRWDAFVDISDDDGLTWRRTPDLDLDRQACPGAGIIQPTLWSGPDGAVHLLARSTCGSLVEARSTDRGETWSRAVPGSVPNNNSGVSAVAVDDRVYLAHNPVGGDWAPRAPLVVSASDDDGTTWTHVSTLEESRPTDEVEGYAPAASGVVTTGANEFSYPTLLATPTGLAVSYTWQRRAIVLALLDTPRSDA